MVKFNYLIGNLLLKLNITNKIFAPALITNKNIFMNSFNKIF